MADDQRDWVPVDLDKASGAAVVPPAGLPTDMKLPPVDMSSQYNTALTPLEEAQFQTWAKTNNRMGDTADYDLRGAWKADAQAAANGHLPDTWKKPNHPTFSEESQYSTPENPGGSWKQGDDKNWMFIATPANLKYRTPDALQDYMKTREPDTKLVLPPAKAGTDGR